MTPTQFCYWLQGAFEILDPDDLTKEQVRTVQRHLALVFEHVLDKEHDKGDPKKAAKLNKIHSAGPTKFRC